MGSGEGRRAGGGDPEAGRLRSCRAAGEGGGTEEAGRPGNRPGSREARPRRRRGPHRTPGQPREAAAAGSRRCRGRRGRTRRGPGAAQRRRREPEPMVGMLGRSAGGGCPWRDAAALWTPGPAAASRIAGGVCSSPASRERPELSAELCVRRAGGPAGAPPHLLALGGPGAGGLRRACSGREAGESSERCPPGRPVARGPDSGPAAAGRGAVGSRPRECGEGGGVCPRGSLSGTTAAAGQGGPRT